MTCPESATEIATEYLLLLRHLAAAQRRATALADDLARLQHQHQTAEARWQASLADRDALIARLWEGLAASASPSLAHRLAAHGRCLEPPVTRSDRAHAVAELVICQTGCIGHGLPWQRGDRCARTGQLCTLAAAVKLPNLPSETLRDEP